MKKRNKSDIIAHLYAQFEKEIPKGILDKIITRTVDYINHETLNAGNEVSITKFGKFCARTNVYGSPRNPNTGEIVNGVVTEKIVFLDSKKTRRKYAQRKKVPFRNEGR